MSRGNPWRIWEVKDTGKLAFSYNKEQQPEFGTKVLVYITELSTQLNLFADVPPKDQCRHVLKEISKLKMVGFMD